ncbi:MAG: Ig-like domain-containing protein [Gemmatimonadota bacterium]|nr:Ig-like domain-containing protein [Gemmatimonadota bacterium]
MRRLIAFAVIVAAAAACASSQYPPGGPEDHEPPKLLSVSPESGAVNARPPAVVFRFDEVVSERPQGATDLRGLIVISPRDGDARVDWHRSSISVRARRDWRPNTVYTITLLPGITDLRNNVRKERTTISFSTGPTFPRGRIAGIIYDWAANRGISVASIEAVRRPDSTVFVARADSSGRFELPFLSPATYVVYGYQDVNNNHARDPREMFDSTVVTLSDTASLRLLAFVHDSVGPGLSAIEVRDSLTVRLTFDQPVPAPIDTTVFRVLAADSSRDRVAQIMSAMDYDRIVSDSVQRADSLRRIRDSIPLPPPRRVARDTLAPPPAPTLTGPLPMTGVVLRLATPLRAGAQYRIETTTLRNLLGKTRPISRVFTAPKPAPPPADSLRRPLPGAPRTPAAADTARRRPPRA